MHLFHIATRADWEAARRAGSYTTSTHGRSLDQEGFIHAAYREQVPTVFGRHYHDVQEPLVLLTVDTARLTSPWSDEVVGAETYPHIRGPINVEAVRHASPLNRRGGTESFLMIFIREMLGRITLAMVVMVLMLIGLLVGQTRPDSDWGGLIGAAIGLVLGLLVVALLRRRR